MPTLSNNKIIQYFIHSAFINDVEVSGVQTASVSKSFDTTVIMSKNTPLVLNQFYKKPSVSITISKFIGETVPAYFSGYSLIDTLYSPPVSYDIKIGVIGGSGIYMQDAILTGLSYTYETQGFFTENMTYTGHVTSGISEINETETQTGIVYRRKDFLQGTLPSQIDSGNILLSAEVNLNLNYGEIPTYGKFPINSNKYISVPTDITCSYQVLDLGYSQSREDYSSPLDHVNDILSYESIVIGGPPQINIGSNNFLTSIERNGGEAGGNSYSTLTFSYKNNHNQFSIS